MSSYILAADLEPYRVDHDPSVSVPINKIEDGIRQAAICFAEITLDNPNVWFELGYALASQKEICMVCSQESRGKYPFDIQHRTVISYSTDSPSDYEILKKKITESLKARLATSENMAIINTTSVLNENEEMSHHEIVVLSAIFENQWGLSDKVDHRTLRSQMERLGYNNLALNIGLMKLFHRKMITEDRIETEDSLFYMYSVSDVGMEWLARNDSLFNLLSPKKARASLKDTSKTAEASDIDDEIPF